ncbi:MAG: permease [Actinobacteria bacterium]|nr:permease [Actinomycetota bacterium]
MTEWKTEWKPLFWIVAGFLVFYFLPLGRPRFDNAVMEALELAKWYAQEHVILCLLPAFFIAGAIAVFVSQTAVMKYLGPGANKVVAYSVASVSGTILAVCSCTVLPLFAGIKRMGAGLGPATAFLYSGPAINILAIILTARILGLELGVARAIGAIVFSVVIGLLMHFFYRKEERAQAEAASMAVTPEETRPLWQNVVFLGLLIAILVFANWGRPEATSGIWYGIYSVKWILTALSAAGLGVVLVVVIGFAWWKVVAAAVPVLALALVFPQYPQLAFVAGVVGLAVIASTDKGEGADWFDASWGFAKQILPLLLIGVLIAGLLLGRPGEQGLIPEEWVATAVGGNSIQSNLFAAFAGAFMYFATLTEVPIVQGLLGAGMGKGPALALLLAGPALSLPNMLVIRSVIGTRKTAVFVGLVVLMATITGFIFGLFVE